jgi:hypothetical protein
LRFAVQRSLIERHPPHRRVSPREIAPRRGPGPRIAFFGHDATDSTIVKRVTAFQANGAQVSGFMFRRERGMPGRAPTWDNVDLGQTADRNYAARLPKLAAGAMRAAGHRDTLRACDIVYARNLDMLLVALLARRLAGSHASLVYECLDIQRLMAGDRLHSKLLRWSERKLLQESDLLVVSSPDYLEQYFAPLQNYRGPSFVLENKPLRTSLPPSLAHLRRERPPGLPWTIGWFGVLRCTRSLGILRRIAERLPKKVQIYIRGVPSETDIAPGDLLDLCARHPNLVYGGPYRNPDDLRDIYGRLHFIWASDFADPGGNSKWCLTNRLYEGGLCGTVPLAAHDTATGRFVARKGLGFTLEEPLEETAPAFFKCLDAEMYWRACQRVRAAPESLFVDEQDTRRLLEVMTALRTGHGSA